MRFNIYSCLRVRGDVLNSRNVRLINLRHCYRQYELIICLIGIELFDCIIANNNSLERSIAALRSFKREGVCVRLTHFRRNLNGEYDSRLRNR